MIADTRSRRSDILKSRRDVVEKLMVKTCARDTVQLIESKGPGTRLEREQAKKDERVPDRELQDRKRHEETNSLKTRRKRSEYIYLLFMFAHPRSHQSRTLGAPPHG